MVSTPPQDTARFFQIPGESRRIDLLEVDSAPTGHWIDVKKRFTIADQDSLADRLVTIEQADNPAVNAMSRQQRREWQRKHPGESSKTTIRQSQVALMEVAILAWSFDLPISTENIGMLLPEWADQIVDILDSLNPTQGAPQPTS